MAAASEPRDRQHHASTCGLIRSAAQHFMRREHMEGFTRVNPRAFSMARSMHCDLLTYASSTLSEIEARLHYLRSQHGHASRKALP